MLVATGLAVGLDIEHRDDFTEPRELGVAVREAVPFDEAAATSSTEHSVIWEADRFVHLGVATEHDLDELVARGQPRPRIFVVPEREKDLIASLARRFPSSRRGAAVVFDLGNKDAPNGRSR
jgi:hypothetical protein